MKKDKWKKLVVIGTTLLGSMYGINMYTGVNNADTIHEQVPAVINNNQVVILFGKTYNLEDGQQIQITIDKFNRKRVIFTPGGNHDR